jgi:hypothetical protein
MTEQRAGWSAVNNNVPELLHATSFSPTSGAISPLRTER